VAPLSVLSNWVHQIKEHTTEGLLHVHTYYDKGRNILPSKLEKFDVVITTYETVTGDWKRAGLKPDFDSPAPKKPKFDDNLFGVKWKVKSKVLLLYPLTPFQRVVLDEGHQIRNPKTIVAQAVCRLEADRRWILTGTPIVSDLRSQPLPNGALNLFISVD
jgi:SWI/SNF-related matrix-associated actin-dependent regulator of chromatin subfamily A3